MRRLVFVFFLQTVSLLASDKATWSLGATKLHPCVSGHDCASKSKSSNGTVVTLFRTSNNVDNGKLVFLTKQTGELTVPANPEWNAWPGVNVLWSPDSQFIAVTAGINAYTESTRIFQITSTKVAPLEPFREIIADMLRSFPPCNAANIDHDDCQRQERNPFFNLAAIAWSAPSTLVVMSEVPCSSSYGGAMCQVMGYEINVQTGDISSTDEC